MCKFPSVEAHELNFAADRKVRCDLRLPTCSNCSHAKRQCLGYGFRLAWPRNGDKRRMLVYNPLHASDNIEEVRSSKSFLLVNVLSDDIRLNYDLSQRDLDDPQSLASTRSASSDEDTARKCSIKTLPMSKTMSWELFDERGRSLLNFCW